MKGDINKYIFFPALLLGMGGGYALLHEGYGTDRGEGTGASGFRAFLTPSSPAEKPETLSVLRKRQKVRKFRSRLTGDPARDWECLLSLGEYDREIIEALTEYWGRHCPRLAWQSLDAPEFRKKYDKHIIGQLKNHLLSAWLESSPEEAWAFGETLLASGSEWEGRWGILEEMAFFRGRENTEDALEWAFSLSSSEQKESMPDDRVIALYQVACRDKQRGDEWAAAFKKHWPRLQSSTGAGLMSYFAVNNLGQGKADQWVESLPLSKSDKKKMQKELADSKVSSGIFDTDDNLREILAKTGPENRSSVFFKSCSSNEEELIRYAASLPEGEEKGQALAALSEHSEHMEYKDRLALLKNIPQKERGQALYGLFSEWGRGDCREAARAVEESPILSEDEKQELRYGRTCTSSFVSMEPGHMGQRLFYEGKKERFDDEYVNFSNVAENTAPEK